MEILPSGEQAHVKSALHVRSRLTKAFTSLHCDFKFPAADHIDAFADWLHHNGYKPVTITSLLRSLAGWTDWMLATGITAENLLAGFEACKLALRKHPRVRYSRGANQHSLTAASLFIRFLQAQGEIPAPIALPSASERWPILAEFRLWMRRNRGLTESTMDAYQHILVALDALGVETRTYSAESLRDFVLYRARPHGMERAKSVVVAVRSFIRFLAVTGAPLAPPSGQV